jgi:hypothetical protein
MKRILVIVCLIVPSLAQADLIISTPKETSVADGSGGTWSSPVTTPPKTASTGGSGTWGISTTPKTTPTTSSSGGTWTVPTTPKTTSTTSSGGTWTISVPTTKTAGNQSGGAATWTLSPAKNAEGQDVNDGTWTISTVETGVQIYQTSSFQNIEGSLFSLQLNLASILGEYGQAQDGDGSGEWTISTNSSTSKNTTSPTGHTQVVQATSSNFDYASHLKKYLSYITGTSDSYLVFTKEMFTAYGELEGMYTGQMTKDKKTPDPSAAAYFQKLPFQKGSFVLSLLQGAVGSLLDFVHTRMALITVNNYSSAENKLFFTGDSTAKPAIPSVLTQLATAVGMFNAQCEAEYKIAKSAPGITGEEVAQLEKNYKSIIDSYSKEVSRLIITFNLKLLKYLTKQYPIQLSLNPLVTEITIDFTTLQTLYSLSQAGLTLLAPTPAPAATSTTTSSPAGTTTDDSKTADSPPASQDLLFGQYESTDAVINAMRTMLAELYVYAGAVAQNSIKQDVEKKDAKIDVASLQNRMNIIGTFYANAASYYQNIGNTVSYNAYYSFSKNMLLAKNAWVTAATSDKQNNIASYLFAAKQYNLAYEELKQVGSAGLAFLMLQFKNAAELNAAKGMLTSYSKYHGYQTFIQEYVDNAGQVPTGTLEDLSDSLPQSLSSNVFYVPIFDSATKNKTTPSQQMVFQDLFYTQKSKSFKGLGLLAAGVSQSYKMALNSLETSKEQVQQTEKDQLKNALTVVGNIALGGQTMLVSSTNPDGTTGLAADAQLLQTRKNPKDPSGASFGPTNPISVFEALTNYRSVIKVFALADKANKAIPDNPYAPVSNLFSKTTNIKTFEDFIRLHLAYICVMSASYAEGYIQSLKQQGKTFVYYENKSAVAKLFSLQCAEKMYATLGGYDPMVSYCQEQLLTLRPYMAAILADAQSRIEGKTITQQQYQMAMAESLGVALLGDATADTQYQSILQSYIQVMQKNEFEEDFPELVEAYTQYKLYLWALYKNPAGAAAVKTDMDASFQKLVTAIQNQVTIAGPSTTLYKDRIAAQVKLKGLQNTLETYVTEQQEDQALLGLSGHDFCTIVESGGTDSSPVPHVAMTFTSQLNITIVNSLYALAQLLSQEATNSKELLQQDFDNRDYAPQTESAFSSILGGYRNALDLYSELGLQDEVVDVEESITKAIAFRYLSLVIPSDQVYSTIKLKQIATITKTQPGSDSGSGSGTWTISTTKGPISQSGSGSGTWTVSSGGGSGSSGGGTTQPSTITLTQQIPLNFPSYLLRYWVVNLTEASDKADTVATQSQAQIKKGSGLKIPPAIAQKQQFYKTLLTSATSLVGKTGAQTATDIVTQLAVPVYKQNLTSGGFQGVFKTLDQEVTDYQTQIVYMIGTGMQIGGNTLKSTLEVTTQPNPTTGKDDVVMIGHYMPLPCVPRYKNDIQSAIFYYSLYKKFFAAGGQPVTIGPNIYFPIGSTSVQSDRLRAEKEMDRAYLASTLRFDEEIESIIKPLKAMTTSQRLNANFKTYSDTYTQLDKAYQWIEATYQGIDQLQKEEGVEYIDISKKETELYQQYAQNCTYFLFGTPLAPQYANIIKDIGQNYLFATQYATGTAAPAFKNQMYSAAAKVNETAGDWCTAQNQIVPQVDGYPSTSPSNFPGTISTLKTHAGLTCAAQPSYLMPKGQTIKWKYHQEAQGYYTEALSLYTKGYEAVHSGSAAGLYNQSTIRNLAGKTIMASIWAAIQRISLFTQNTWLVKKGVTKDKVVKYAVTPSGTFSSIKADGSSAGAISALQGANALVSGGAPTTSSHAVAQYNLMKKILLDAIIYMSPATALIEKISKTLPTATTTEAKTTIPTATGRAILCATLYNIPDLSLMISGAKKTSKPQLTPILALIKTPTMVTLGSALFPNWKIILQYADTFPSFVQYAATTLVGSESDQFSSLTNTVQLGALSDLNAQLYGLARDLYQQTFLANLLKVQGLDGTKKAETSLTTALNAEKQQLLVNPTGYIG